MDSRELMMVERRELIEQVRTAVRMNVLEREDAMMIAIRYSRKPSV